MSSHTSAGDTVVDFGRDVPTSGEDVAVRGDSTVLGTTEASDARRGLPRHACPAPNRLERPRIGVVSSAIPDAGVLVRSGTIRRLHPPKEPRRGHEALCRIHW